LAAVSGISNVTRLDAINLGTSRRFPTKLKRTNGGLGCSEPKALRMNSFIQRALVNVKVMLGRCSEDLMSTAVGAAGLLEGLLTRAPQRPIPLSEGSKLNTIHRWAACETAGNAFRKTATGRP